MIDIAVCDDEAYDLENTVNIIGEILQANCIDYNLRRFLSANELLESIKKLDVGVLDVSMAEMNGIKLGQKIKEKFPDAKLIYTTSYEEYCQRAINEAHAFSFLCKPLDRNEMERQVTELISQAEDANEMEFYNLTDGSGKHYPSLKIRLRDIIYFEYGKRSRKISIILPGETFECSCTFGKLAEELQQYDFSVNCRGNIVNLRHIENIKGYSICMDNGKELPLAQKRSVVFKQALNEFLHKNS